MATRPDQETRKSDKAWPLYFAEEARRDPSLLPNHGSTFARQLQRLLSEAEACLNTVAGCADLEDFEAELVADIAAFKHALTAYPPEYGGTQTKDADAAPADPAPVSG